MYCPPRVKGTRSGTGTKQCILQTMPLLRYHYVPSLLTPAKKIVLSQGKEAKRGVEQRPVKQVWRLI